MHKKFRHFLSLVAVVFLAFASCFVFKEAQAAASSGPPILERSQEWYTFGGTYVLSMFAEDVDGDGVKEILTGGFAFDGTRDNAQLRIWNWSGSTRKLKLETSREWYTGSWTYVIGVYADDVDNDGVKEIVTGGYAYDGLRDNAQLRIWNWSGSTLMLEKSREWYMDGNTHVHSVFVDDVDNNGAKEVLTVGFAYVGTLENGQLRIWTWNGSTLTLKKSQEWNLGGQDHVWSVCVGDADGDGVKDIITGGFGNDGTRDRADLEFWSWNGSTLTNEGGYTWSSPTGNTRLHSVFVDDVEGDGSKEIITGGYAFDGTRETAQLRIWSWDGSMLVQWKNEEWYMGSHTYVWSVFVDDVDNDGVKEILAGGYTHDYIRDNGQLRIWSWDGSTLTLEGNQFWFTVSSTYVRSVLVRDVDSDGIKETITAGYANDGTRVNGQLRVWALPLVDLLNVNIDAGTTYFRGELAEFYIQVSYRGTPLYATQIITTLHRPDGTKTSLIGQYVDKGLCKVSYTIPTDAPTGTYTLSVEASYQTNARDLRGASLKSFALSPTLNQWNAWLLTVQQDTATIKTDMVLVKLNLTEINANITAINGNVAIIETDVGTIKANVTAINARITSIDGNIATIETDVGTIKTDVSDIDTESIPSLANTQGSQGTILYLTTAFSAIAAIGALGALFLILRKIKQT